MGGGIRMCALLVILMVPKGWSVLLTGAYVVFILYETLMFRETGNARMILCCFLMPEIS